MRDVWEIPRLQSNSKERVGWKTQKPLTLYERIIEASTKPDDFVLDPFCGCATTCVVAERLSRQWVGIDIDKVAEKVTKERLNREVWTLMNVEKHNVEVFTQPPKRTDGSQPVRSKYIKEQRYKEQQGICNGPCKRPLPPDLLEIDHIYPRSKGGRDIDDNLQLLCPPCNRRKSNKILI